MPSAKPGLFVRFNPSVKAYIEEEAKKYNMNGSEFLRAATALLFFTLEQLPESIDEEDKPDCLSVWLSAMADFEQAITKVACRKEKSLTTSKIISIQNSDIKEAMSVLSTSYGSFETFKNEVNQDFQDASEGKLPSRWEEDREVEGDNHGY